MCQLDKQKLNNLLLAIKASKLNYQVILDRYGDGIRNMLYKLVKDGYIKRHRSSGSNSDYYEITEAGLKHCIPRNPHSIKPRKFPLPGKDWHCPHQPNYNNPNLITINLDP